MILIVVGQIVFGIKSVYECVLFNSTREYHFDQEEKRSKIINNREGIQRKKKERGMEWWE